VRELLLRLDSHELTEWQCYYALEPFGEERADLRMGIATSVLANVNRNPEQRSEPYTAKDFMPQFSEAAEPPKKVPVTTEIAYFKLRSMLAAARERKEEKQRGTKARPPGGKK
jgi:hypothetical protein